jgi:outer membrane protein TolC
MDIISQTKTAYYNYVFGLESYGIAELYLQRTQDLLDINRARYAKGLVSSVDLLESEAAVADREKYLLAAEYILKTSEDKLKFVTNLIDDPEIWNTMIELIDRPEFTVEKVDLVKCIEDAFQYRPDYQSKKIDLRNRDIRITVAKNALLPTVDVIGSFGLNGIAENYGGALNRIDRNFTDWSIGGKVEIPWGMGDRARYDQKKLEKARAILELERLEQNIILVVRDKAREVDIQYRQERAAKISKEKETENYAAQKERLAAGQVSTHDMLDYQDKLSRAELDHTKAVIDYSTALINLDKEVGLTLVKNNIKLED